MYLDAQQTFSDAQALTATAASTNLLDLGPGAERRIGTGEPMAVVITVDVAAGGTTPTLIVTLQSDDNSGFSSAASVVVSKTFAAADMVAGALFVLPVPPGSLTERYVRLNYTVGGTTPTVTVTSELQPQNMIQNYSSYAKGYVIS